MLDMIVNISLERKLTGWLVLIAVFLSCSHQEIKLPKEIEIVFQKAGENRTELEEVIRHYSLREEDSLKIKATYFLLNGMQDLYYYKGELLDNYLDYLKLVNRDKKNGLYVMESLKEFNGPFSIDELDKYYDIKTVKSDDLINNIDMAFKVWRAQPWGKDVSFQQFCEFILPFRIADEEPDYHREYFYNKFNGLLDSVRSMNGTASDACKVLNDKLMEQKWLISNKLERLPHFPALKLLEYRTGLCPDMADLGVYVMRANGIPVTIDFLPQWPYRSFGHNWNVVLSRDGKMIMFLGNEDSPGTPHKEGLKKAKVYRHTYAINPQSLAMIKNRDEFIPGFLKNRRIKDVTEEYVKCFDISMPITSSHNKKIVYICVYNDEKWVPVHWGAIKKNNNTIFSKMEGGILYLPGIFTDTNKIDPVNHPFLLDTLGNIRYVIPDLHHTVDLQIKERSPILPDWYEVDKLIAGKFQGSNRADFSDAIDLYLVKTRPKPFVNSIRLKNNERFRYLRYLSSPGNFCNIGKFTFYNLAGALKGNAISNGTCYNQYPIIDNESTLEKMPGYYNSGFSSSGWVGIDLGKRENISAIKFSAKIQLSKNPTLIDGHSYELFFWNEHKWQSLQIKAARNGVINFHSVPKNGLYRLIDLEEDEEIRRIFTYVHGRQIWW